MNSLKNASFCGTSDENPINWWQNKRFSLNTHAEHQTEKISSIKLPKPFGCIQFASRENNLVICVFVKKRKRFSDDNDGDNDSYHLICSCGKPDAFGTDFRFQWASVSCDVEPLYWLSTDTCTAPTLQSSKNVQNCGLINTNEKFSI